MVVVTIELETAEDEARLLALLPTIHGRIVEKNDVSAQTSGDINAQRQRLKNAMTKLGQMNTAQKFGDPSAWQRDIRSWDRALDGREE